MTPEPDLDDVPVADGSGRYWRHLKTSSVRIDEAEKMRLDIAECGLFIAYDPHETEAYLSLKTADGATQAVTLVGMSGVWDVRGRDGREGTTEEWRLAEAMAPAVHLEVLRQAGFVVEDEVGGMSP